MRTESLLIQTIFTEYRQQENLLMRVMSRIIPLLRDVWFFCTFARWFCKTIGDFVLLYVMQQILIETALKRRQALSPKWSALWKMTIRHKNAWEIQCFLNQCKIISIIEQNHRLTTKMPTDLDEALCQLIRQRLFAMRQNWWVTEIWSFCQHAQFYFGERRGLSWFSCWKSHHENAEENSTANERFIHAVYRFSARLRISIYQLHAEMIFTTLFLD